MAMTKLMSPEQLRDHDKLHNLASDLAQEVCRKINQEAVKLDTPTMPYRQKYVLEEVIQILESKV